jgi:hypothetical protein
MGKTITISQKQLERIVGTFLWIKRNDYTSVLLNEPTNFNPQQVVELFGGEYDWEIKQEVLYLYPKENKNR